MSLLDEMDTEVVAYRPERAGEGVEGVIVAIDVTTSEYTTDDIPVITLRTDDGIFRGVRGYHGVLRTELNKVDPAIGDRLAVMYDGKKQTRDKKRTFHSYKVRVVRGGGTAGGSGADEEAPF